MQGRFKAYRGAMYLEVLILLCTQTRQTGRRLGRSQGWHLCATVKFKAESPRSGMPGQAHWHHFGWKALGNSRTCHYGGRMCYKVALILGVFWLLSSVKFEKDKDLMCAAGMGGGTLWKTAASFTVAQLWLGYKAIGFVKAWNLGWPAPGRPGPPPPVAQTQSHLEGKLLSNNWAIMGPLVPTRMFLSSSLLINSF